TVRDVLHPPEKIVGVRPEEDVLEVLNLLANRDLNQVPVLEKGHMVGLVRRADILRWLALHGSPAGAKPARS
ncbi:MAG: CBS domain-containing protein, partial [Pseudomonadota bacterium]|nr:CBS domain-containing protein [Pseudomonadota bacterium]